MAQPIVDGERCVLSIAVDAGCRACADVCPRRAFVMSEDTLGLDTDACDGCAICVAACPRRAITLARTAAAVSVDDPSVVLVACTVSGVASGPGAMACLDAVGLDELAGLYARGARRLLVARGECATCARGTRAIFDAAIGDLGRLLEDRRLTPIAVAELPAGEWSRQRAAATAPSRRGFLLAVRGRHRRDTSPAHEPQPAARALPAPSRPDPLNPFLPVIDGAACTACDACVRICPDGALRLEIADTGTAAYQIEPRRCTGCRLCADVCDARAMSVATWLRGGASALRLDRAQCKSCGNVFRRPAGRRSESRACRVCEAAAPSRNLFQVIA